MKNADLVTLYSSKLNDIFSPLIPRERPAALVDFPDTANCGDHAIWLGEKKLLRELSIQVAYECAAQTYDKAEMAERLGDGTILIHGSGTFGDRTSPRHGFRLKVLEDFPHNKVIVFPQQAYFVDNACLERTVAQVTRHPDVTLFARGVVAQHLLSRYFGSTARIELATDMSFMLGPQPRLKEPIYDIVWIARTDQEHANDQTELAARLSSQAAEKFELPRFPDGIEIHFVVKHRPPTVLLTDWYSLFLENELSRLALRQLDADARAEVYVSRALHMLSLGHVVITDRLHGHILCLLLGIPHILLNNGSGKNWNFYETWTRESPLCRLASSPAEAWALARTAVPHIKERKSAVQSWNWHEMPAAAAG